MWIRLTNTYENSRKVFCCNLQAKRVDRPGLQRLNDRNKSMGGLVGSRLHCVAVVQCAARYSFMREVIGTRHTALLLKSTERG